MVAALLIVMGVNGCGKSTVASGLAQRLGLEFVEGDDAHSEENIRKMSSGVSLSDEDRLPWLLRLREQAVNLIDASVEHRRVNPIGSKALMAVIACSALKRSYRDILRDTKLDDRSTNASGCPADLETCFIYLKGTRHLLEKRMRQRQGHFMGVEMLNSQLQTLEEPNAETEDSINSSIITVLLDGQDDQQDINSSDIIEDIVAQLDAKGYFPASPQPSRTIASEALPPIVKMVGPNCDPQRAKDALSLLFEVSESIERCLIPLLQETEPLPSNYLELVSLCHHLVQHRFNVEDKGSFLGSHPRIGEVSGLSKMSSKEQKNHKAADPKVLQELQRLNQVYETVYPGLRYVTFVNGRERIEIMDEMQKKLYGTSGLGGTPATHDRESQWSEELSRGIDNVFRIAQSRLQLIITTEDVLRQGWGVQSTGQGALQG